MNHTLTVARREIAEKRFVFTAAVALATLVFMIPLFPRVPSSEWRTIYVVGSAILSSGFAVGLATILGVSIVGREITDRRLSFYFTKPIAAPTIWFGKLIAAALLVAGTFSIAMIPGLAAGSKALHGVWDGKGYELLLPLAALATTFFFLAHILGTIARSRSAWAFVDLVAVVLLATAAWLLAQPLANRFAFVMLAFIGSVFRWLALVAVIAAGAWQLSVGRTDRQQSHLALSKFLWPALAVALAICGGIVAWVVSATPRDLMDGVLVQTAPRGEYAIISGTAAHRRDYSPVFLINVRNGEFARLDEMPLHGGFSADGSKVALVRPLGRGANTIGEVMVRDAAKNGGERATGLIIGQHTWPISISPDANRIAYVTSGVLTVYDVAHKQSLGAARVAAQRIQSMLFISPDVLRLYTVSPSDHMTVAPRSLVIYEYNTISRTLMKTGEFVKAAKYLIPTANADASRLFIREPGGGLTMIDGRTGAVLKEMPDLRGLTALRDGRMVAASGNMLRILSADGVVQREIPVARPGEQQWFARPLSADKVFVGLNRQSNDPRSWRFALIDVNTGAIIRQEQNLRPNFADAPFGDIRRTEMNPDQLFRDAKGNVIRWNALTNERNIVIPARG